MKTKISPQNNTTLKSKLIGLGTGILLLGVFTTGAFAQSNYATIPSASTIKVLGSSNLHDWTMEDPSINANAVFTVQGNQITDLTALNFSMPVKGLKSKEDLMDTRAYKALNEEQFKNITFKLSNAKVVAQGDHYLITAIGKLQISGVTKDISLSATADVNGDKSISCNGTKKIKMSEFGIKPPTFMFGALKVTDEVTINFNFKFKN